MLDNIIARLPRRFLAIFEASSFSLFFSPPSRHRSLCRSRTIYAFSQTRWPRKGEAVFFVIIFARTRARLCCCRSRFQSSKTSRRLPFTYDNTSSKLKLQRRKCCRCLHNDVSLAFVISAQVKDYQSRSVLHVLLVAPSQITPVEFARSIRETASLKEVQY